VRVGDHLPILPRPQFYAACLAQDIRLPPSLPRRGGTIGRLTLSLPSFPSIGCLSSKRATNSGVGPLPAAAGATQALLSWVTLQQRSRCILRPRNPHFAQGPPAPEELVQKDALKTGAFFGSPKDFINRELICLSLKSSGSREAQDPTQPLI